MHAYLGVSSTEPCFKVCTVFQHSLYAWHQNFGFAHHHHEARNSLTPKTPISWKVLVAKLLPTPQWHSYLLACGFRGTRVGLNVMLIERVASGNAIAGATHFHSYSLTSKKAEGTICSILFLILKPGSRQESRDHQMSLGQPCVQ